MALEVLINVLNAVISTLNKFEYNLYDNADPEWYITEICYDEKLDKLYFKCEEEKRK